jgi:hypothetical protein
MSALPEVRKCDITEPLFSLENVHKILVYFQDEILGAPCSKGHHYAFKGGLPMHLDHVLDNAKMYFPKDLRLQFLAGIHDIGKARVYRFVERNGKETIEYRKPEVDHIIHTIAMLAEVGVILGTCELHALQFHHGGWSQFKGDLNPIAVKLHFCDLLATSIESGCLK